MKSDNLVSLEAALETLNEDLVSAALEPRLCATYWRMISQLSCWTSRCRRWTASRPPIDSFRKRSQILHLIFDGYRNEEHLFRVRFCGGRSFVSSRSFRKYCAPSGCFRGNSSRSAQRQRRQAEILAKAELKFRSLLRPRDAMLMTTAESEIVWPIRVPTICLVYKHASGRPPAKNGISAPPWPEFRLPCAGAARCV